MTTTSYQNRNKESKIINAYDRASIIYSQNLNEELYACRKVIINLTVPDGAGLVPPHDAQRAGCSNNSFRRLGSKGTAVAKGGMGGPTPMATFCGEKKFIGRDV